MAAPLISLNPTPAEVALLHERMRDPWWRINNLYMIRPRGGGDPIQFKANAIQEKFYRNLHRRNVVLKARGIGMTTFICLLELDKALYISGTTVGIVAHVQDKAEEIFGDIVRFAYDNHRIPVLRPGLKPGTEGSKSDLYFDNNSSIRVSVQLTSGTYQIIHSTELGVQSIDAPQKAKDFVLGSLPTVRDDKALIFIESTAKGTRGTFFDMVKVARKSDEEVESGKRARHNLDYRFHFFPWHEDDTKVLRAEVVIPKETEEYFQSLADKNGIHLSSEQKAWYHTTATVQGEAMKCNYPSTPEEAFEASMEGLYFTKELNLAMREKRIGTYRYDPRFVVDTWWDLGMNDETAIWVSQTTGNRVQFIDYYENSGEGILHYIDYLRGKPWVKRYGRHVGPHDLKNRSLQTGQDMRTYARLHGFRFEYVERPPSKRDAIEACRMMLARCCFDEENCFAGLEHLRMFTKERDKRTGAWKDSPRHDAHIHANDAFQTFALWHDKVIGRANMVVPKVGYAKSPLV